MCGKKLTVEHAFTCSTGGFPTLRHNDIRDLTADLMAEVTSNVCTEPEYYQGEICKDDCSRGSPCGHQGREFMGAVPRCIFDVRVFNPFAPINHTQNLNATYQRHEKEK